MLQDTATICVSVISRGKLLMGICLKWMIEMYTARTSSFSRRAYVNENRRFTTC